MSQHLLTDSAVMEWLRKQDPATTYDYSNPQACAGYLYLKAMGFPVYTFGLTNWFDKEDWHHETEFSSKWIDAVPALPHTFGDLLARMEA